MKRVARISPEEYHLNDSWWTQEWARGQELTKEPRSCESESDSPVEPLLALIAEALLPTE